MNGTIKFRTWDTEHKEFAEWTNRDPFFSTSSGKLFFWERTLKEDGGYSGDIILEDLGCRFILQQYTGLKDNNGVEIYEGDILACPWHFYPDHKSIGFVVFWEGAFHLAKREETDEELKQFCPWDCYGFNDKPTRRGFWHEAEVIGNIMQNPELLKS